MPRPSWHVAQRQNPRVSSPTSHIQPNARVEKIRQPAPAALSHDLMRERRYVNRRSPVNQTAFQHCHDKCVVSGSALLLL